VTDPERLAEIREYVDALYGKNVAGPKDLINIRVGTLDWLVGEVEEVSERLAAAQVTIGQLSHEIAQERQKTATPPKRDGGL